MITTNSLQIVTTNMFKYFIDNVDDDNSLGLIEYFIRFITNS